MIKIVILQEFIPDYRIDFFKQIELEAKRFDLDVKIAAGTPSATFKTRGDSSAATPDYQVKQIELVIRGKRITLRLIPKIARRADLVIYEHARRNIDAFVAAIVHPNRFALYGHGKDYVQDSGYFSKFLMNFLARRACQYLVYTESGKPPLLDLGIEPDRITVVNNSKSPAITPTRGGAATVHPDLHHLIYLGALADGKKIEFLIAAFREIVSAKPQAHLTLVGDGPLRRQLEKTTRDLAQVEFTGYLTGTQLADRLSKAAIICNPGRVGLVAIDSFGSGRPIVTTNSHFHAPEFDYLMHDHNCLVSKDNVASYSDSVIALMSDQHRYERLQHGCWTSADMYSVEKASKTFVQGIRLALNRVGHDV